MANPQKKKPYYPRIGEGSGELGSLQTRQDDFGFAISSAGYKKKHKIPEYDIQEDHVKPEPPSGFKGPSKEDDVLSRTRYEQPRPGYSEKKVYTDKGKVQFSSRDIFVESWSYSSLIPSVRTWSSIIAILLGPFVLSLFGISVTGANRVAMSMMLPAGIALLLIAGFLSLYEVSVNHAIKDTFVHGVIIIAIAILYPWNRGASGFINVISIYLSSHIMAHGVDFHLERADGRWWKLTLAVLFITWLLLAIGYGAFNLNRVSIFG